MRSSRTLSALSSPSGSASHLTHLFFTVLFSPTLQSPPSDMGAAPRSPPLQSLLSRLSSRCQAASRAMPYSLRAASLLGRCRCSTQLQATSTATMPRVAARSSAEQRGTYGSGQRAWCLVACMRRCSPHLSRLLGSPRQASSLLPTPSLTLVSLTSSILASIGVFFHWCK